MGQFDLLEKKVMTLDQILVIKKKWSSEKNTVVFTNGCFDILHYGHLHYLADASDCGDKLIIGLNSDTSVRNLKGPHRPINDLLTRCSLLAGLSFVDAVIVFENPTPIHLIEKLTPDVLVKGGDWEASQIVGSEWVIQHGGIVKSLPFVKGYSTTNIETKIKNS